MILATTMKIMKMGVKRTVVGSLSKRCLQDDIIQIALLFAQQREVMLVPAIALPLLAIGVVKEETQGKEEGDPLLHLLLHPILQATMQVHKKLAPFHHPKGKEGIDMCILLGKELDVSKSSKKEERTSLSLILMGHMAILIRYFTLFNNLMRLLVVRTSRKALSFAMLLCISKSLLNIGVGYLKSSRASTKDLEGM